MLNLIDGNQKPHRPGARSLDRAMHSAFVSVHGADGNVPSEAIYEIRRGRQHPWRLLGKRLREMREAETPIEQAKEIVKALDLYVDNLYNNTGGTAA
jgi:hypothetical protein